MDHVANNGFHSWHHYHLVHTPVPIPKAMRIAAAKASEDREWTIVKNLQAWNESKVRSKDEVIAETTANNKTVHFAFREARVLRMATTHDYDPVAQEVRQVHLQGVESIAVNSAYWRSHQARFETAARQYEQAAVN